MSAGASSGWLYVGLSLGVAILLPTAVFLASKRKPIPDDHVEEEETVRDCVNVYFGSQTGTAENFAQTVATEGRRYGFQMNVVDLEDFKAEDLLETGNAVFLMATYGDGEPTDNAKDFFTWLSNEEEALPNDHLSSVNYTVFGLGNKQYEHYNFMGKSTNAGLEKLGAKRMYMYGEGDDDAELEEDFEAWKEGLWKALVEKFGGSADVEDADTAFTIPFSVKFITEDDARTIPLSIESQAASSSRFYWQGKDAKVVVNRELRAVGRGSGSTRHIEIDIDGTGISYMTADNLAVLPLNDEVMVERVCQQLGYDPDAIFVMEHGDSYKPAFPTPCSVRDALSRFTDILSVPRRAVLEQLAGYVRDEDEQKSMRYLVSKDGREEYHRAIEGPGMTLSEVILERMTTLTIPLRYFLHVVPHLHPRYYTISSSSNVSPSRIHITVAVLEQRKEGDHVYRGICSNFLRKLDPPHMNGDALTSSTGSSFEKGEGVPMPSCKVFVRASTFRLPEEPATPIVMIGPGTGVAPMRALLQERSWQRARGDKVGHNVLYFGCRCRNEDYIYRDEIEAYVADGTLDRLRLAFSREGKSKVYVQHLLHNDTAEMWKLLSEGAYVYVCGGTQMGKDVSDEFSRIVQKGGSMTAEKSSEYMQTLQADGRYVQELWS